VNPPGGHGSSPENELNVQGLGINFKFSNNESNTIVTSNTLYNKIGIVKDVYYLNSDFSKGNVYTTSTFDQVLKANVTPAHTFVTGEKIKGANSKAVGYVKFMLQVIKIFKKESLLQMQQEVMLRTYKQ
jgi:hypothetical protein